MRTSGRRSRGGRRPAAEGTAPGRWAARGAFEGAGLAAGPLGADNGRGAGARAGGKGAAGRGRAAPRKVRPGTRAAGATPGAAAR